MSEYPSYPQGPPQHVPPYPAGPPPDMAPPPDLARPPSVSRAVRLMMAGAGFTLVSLVVAFGDLSSIKSQLRAKLLNNPSYNGQDINSVVNATVALIIVSALFGMGLWVWMAWANGRGRNWARITATVFFGLDTLGLLADFTRGVPSLSLAFAVIIWLVGLACTVLLWQGDSSRYFALRKMGYDPAHPTPRVNPGAGGAWG